MFKTILMDKWVELDAAVQLHYGLEDGDEITMKGVLAVKHGRFIKVLMPFIRLTGALVPVEGDNFIVTVSNKRVGNTFYWHRLFEKDNKTYVFKSKMQQVDDYIIEFVGLGIGIKLQLDVSKGALVYIDKGYVLKVGKVIIPLPIGLLMGKSSITEFVDDRTGHDLEMCFVVNHPWFGFGFSYMGYFMLDKPSVTAEVE